MPSRCCMSGMSSGRGTTSKGRGIGNSLGNGISRGAGMVTCAGMVGEAAASDETSSAPLLAGANSPPIPPGLLAGQRGCLIGSQSAFSMPQLRRKIQGLTRRAYGFGQGRGIVNTDPLGAEVGIEV